MKFAKGHGTQNDFVLLPDLEAQARLTPAAVSALCDRRRGLGADGVLRVTTAGAALRAGVFGALPEGVAAQDWYMDYRNADGSIAQMCGNGVRVFTHYLRASGLERRDEFVVGSLAGPRPVVVHHGDDVNAEVTVDMGKANVVGSGSAVVAGRSFDGLAVDVGNPHLACVTDLSTTALAVLDVAAPVSFDAAQFPEGVNVEVLTAPQKLPSRCAPARRSTGLSRCAYTSVVSAKPVPVERERWPQWSRPCSTPGRAPVLCWCAFPAVRSPSPSPRPPATCAAHRCSSPTARSPTPGGTRRFEPGPLFGSAENGSPIGNLACHHRYHS